MNRSRSSRRHPATAHPLDPDRAWRDCSGSIGQGLGIEQRPIGRQASPDLTQATLLDPWVRGRDQVVVLDLGQSGSG